MAGKAFSYTAALLLSLSASTVHAYVFVIDEFRIERSFGCVLVDSFNSGGPPPSSPNFCSGNTASYSTQGTFGPESGGKLIIDSANALLATNAAGAARLVHNATSLTNVNPLAPFNLGIRKDDTFKVSAIYDLITPPSPISGYGIRLTDRTQYPSASLANDDLSLQLFTDTGGSTYVRLASQDFSLGTITEWEQVGFLAPLGADQIEFMFSHTNPADSLITSSFRYLSGGSVIAGSEYTLATQVEVFRGEDFIRAGIQAFTAVPAPGSLALLAVGLLSLLRCGGRRRAV